MADNSTTHCKYLWNHVALFNGKTATPCCRYDHAAKDDNNTVISTVTRTKPFTTFTEAIHSEDWIELRRKATAGEKEPGCWKCYEEEERGNRSLRNMANEMGPDISNDLNLTYLEINLGNFCNLACNICCSDNSNLWHKDELVLSKIPEYRRSVYEPDHLNGVALNLDDYKHVEIIKFVGGEPMIHPKFITLLDFLIENKLNKQIQIQVFTNASWLPKDKIKERLELFDNVTISLSVDGTGQVNDYSRWPSKWDVVDEAARMWLTMAKNNSNITVRWEPTLSLYNVLNIQEMIRWWINLSIEIFETSFHESVYNSEIDDINIILNNVMWPEYLTPNLITSKDVICSKLDTFIDEIRELYLDDNIFRSRHMIKRLGNVIEQAKMHISKPSDDKQLQTFINFSNDIDKIRKNNITTQLPELWNLINK